MLPAACCMHKSSWTSAIHGQIVARLSQNAIAKWNVSRYNCIFRPFPVCAFISLFSLHLHEIIAYSKLKSPLQHTRGSILIIALRAALDCKGIVLDAASPWAEWSLIWLAVAAVAAARITKFQLQLIATATTINYLLQLQLHKWSQLTSSATLHLASTIVEQRLGQALIKFSRA